MVGLIQVFLIPLLNVDFPFSFNLHFFRRGGGESCAGCIFFTSLVHFCNICSFSLSHFLPFFKISFDRLSRFKILLWRATSVSYAFLRTCRALHSLRCRCTRHGMLRIKIDRLFALNNCIYWNETPFRLDHGPHA